MTTLAWAILIGMMIAGGVFLAALGAMRRPVALHRALAGLSESSARSPADASPPPRGLEAAGGWFRRVLRLPLTSAQERLLLRCGRSVEDFFTEKLVLAVTGLVLPVVWVAVQAALGMSPHPAPMMLAPVLAVAGYFTADLRLGRGARETDRATAESLYTFFDLVVLERLANASASQAAANAADLASAPLFRRISRGLERARLEQSSPWRELEGIAEEWDLPELGDFADIMRLEEQGAALAETLLARVSELREGHNARLQTEAQRDTEALTIWMTLPALALGLAFIAPPLLALVGR